MAGKLGLLVPEDDTREADRGQARHRHQHGQKDETSLGRADPAVPLLDAPCANDRRSHAGTMAFQQPEAGLALRLSLGLDGIEWRWARSCWSGYIKRSSAEILGALGSRVHQSGGNLPQTLAAG